MHPLRILHALSSVYESLAQDYTGEAKGELSRLIGMLEGWSDADFPARLALIADCHQAISLIRSGKKEQATRVLLMYSTPLWQQLLGET